MVNGLSVLGWGVGGIEAEAAMLGQPYSMLLPEVIGVKLTGKLKEGVTATDLVLTVTQMLRKRGVVGKFVEFFGPGLAGLTIADRATIGNMAPEYGATCGFFPIDDDTIALSRRHQPRRRRGSTLVAAYAKAQGMYRTKTTPDPIFTDVLKLELASIEPSLAGPKRPQDRVRAEGGEVELRHAMEKEFNKRQRQRTRSVDCIRRSPPRWTRTCQGGRQQARAGRRPQSRSRPRRRGDRRDHLVHQHLESERDDRRRPARPQGGGQGPHGEAVGEDLAGARLAGGRRISREVRAAEGSRRARLQPGRLRLHHLHRQFRPAAGGNFRRRSTSNDLVAAAVLSGNRNFEGRVNADVRANYLASPPLVVAYAIAGSMYVDLAKQPLGLDKKGKKVFLKDIWPTSREINSIIRKSITKQMFAKKYANVFKGDAHWRKIAVKGGLTYAWDDRSTYVQNPPYFDGMEQRASGRSTDIVDARVLGLFLDSITTDHISPAGSIKESAPPANICATTR